MVSKLVLPLLVASRKVVPILLLVVVQVGCWRLPSVLVVGGVPCLPEFVVLEVIVRV